MKKLRVCFLSPFSIGGSMRLYNLVRELSLLGLKITVVLPKKSGSPELVNDSLPQSVELVHPIKFGDKGLLSMLSYIPSGILRTLQQEFDIIQSYKITPFSAFPGVIAESFRRRPLIIDCDDWDSLVMRNLGYPSYVYRPIMFLEHLIPKLSQGVVVGSSFLRERMLQSGVPLDRILLLPNAADPHRFDPKAVDGEKIREKYGLDCPTAVYVGFLNKPTEQDLLLLIGAARILRKSKVKVKFLIVGDGTMLASLKELTMSLNLKDSFIFVGFKDPLLYIAASDFAVAPYAAGSIAHKSGSSQKIFLYMSMEKAVITTNVGDFPYYLNYGNAGLIADDNPSDLAEKITLLATDTELRRHFGKVARDRVLHEFTWNRHAQKLVSFYLRITESREPTKN